MPHTDEGATAARLLSARYAMSTQGNYQMLWERFVTFCNAKGFTALPATPVTICSYLGHLFLRSAVRGGSLRPYLSAIAAKHSISGFASPLTDPLVLNTRKGYIAEDARRVTGPPERSAPLPARVAAIALQRALASPFPPTDAESFTQLRANGLLALNFLLCARPASIRELMTGDVRFLAQGPRIEITLRRFKYGETGVVPRIAIRVPIVDDADPVAALLRRLVAAAPASQFLFPGVRNDEPVLASLLNRITSSLIAQTGTVAPLGMKFTPRSLRSGGISSAFATGVPLELIMRISNHQDATVVRRHYLDPQTECSDEARLFFARFLPHHGG